MASSTVVRQEARSIDIPVSLATTVLGLSDAALGDAVAEMGPVELRRLTEAITDYLLLPRPRKAPR